ncbi:hypothetical protein N4G58_11590 [Edwardsiella piscicida]|nr:hypothetical protein N4G58_11590 [Edwardsiella piscicida]
MSGNLARRRRRGGAAVGITLWRGTQQIRVGLQTPVVFVDSLTRGALRPGQAAVLILTARDGRATAEVQRAFIGINGAIPPF